MATFQEHCYTQKVDFQCRLKLDSITQNKYEWSQKTSLIECNKKILPSPWMRDKRTVLISNKALNTYIPLASSSFNKIIKRKIPSPVIPLSCKSHKCGHGHKVDNLNSNIFQALYNRTAQTEGLEHSKKLGHQICLLVEAATYRLQHYKQY